MTAEQRVAGSHPSCSEATLMRHANVRVTMNTYVQVVIPAKRKAQRGIIKQIREVALGGLSSKSEMPAALEKMAL